MSAPVIRRCSPHCGRAYSEADWAALHFVGCQCDEVEHLELRLCAGCGTTLAVVRWSRAAVAP